VWSGVAATIADLVGQLVSADAWHLEIGQEEIGVDHVLW